MSVRWNKAQICGLIKNRLCVESGLIFFRELHALQIFLRSKARSMRGYAKRIFSLRLCANLRNVENLSQIGERSVKPPNELSENRKIFRFNAVRFRQALPQSPSRLRVRQPRRRQDSRASPAFQSAPRRPRPAKW